MGCNQVPSHLLVSYLPDSVNKIDLERARIPRPRSRVKGLSTARSCEIGTIDETFLSEPVDWDHCIPCITVVLLFFQILDARRSIQYCFPNDSKLKKEADTSWL